MNHYEKLGVDPGASQAEIKKAYFALIKRCPPERFPEEFKAVRKAYELLSDGEKRAHYDATLRMPEECVKAYEEASLYIRGGDPEEAVKLLKPLAQKHPDVSALQSLLGEAYIENENYGNAVKAFEKAAQLTRGAKTLSDLAGACVLRGFTKKAVPIYREALSLDEAHIPAWAGLARAYDATQSWRDASEALSMGFEAAKRTGADAALLHTRAISHYILSQNRAKLQEHLGELRKIAKNDPAREKSIAESILDEIYDIPPEPHFQQDIYSVAALSCEIQPDNALAAEIKNTLFNSIMLRKLQNDAEIPEYIVDLTQLALEGCACPNCSVLKAAAELQCYNDASFCRKKVLYLRDAYPDAFSLNKQFYQRLLDVKNEQRNYEQAYKQMMREKKLHPAAYAELFGLGGEEPNNRTAASAKPATGRNEPCPCGSGKKYKKCCGA